MVKPEGNRRTGRPSLRWLEDVEKDLPLTEFPRRREKADDREEWASVIKKAKALREFYFLPFSVHAQTNVIYLTLLALLQ
jgi:hypothetical protein